MKINTDRLKAMMTERGMTQAQLSRVTGIQKTSISQYLSGKFGIGDNNLEAIAKALGTSPAWLAGYTDDPDINGSLILSKSEKRIILEYRSNPEFKASVNALINKPKLDSFRAAKSQDGTVPPSYEKITAEQLQRLEKAPETDEDL